MDASPVVELKWQPQIGPAVPPASGRLGTGADGLKPVNTGLKYLFPQAMVPRSAGLLN
jgi:hypothetical protein